jgi:SprT protein
MTDAEELDLWLQAQVTAKTGELLRRALSPLDLHANRLEIRFDLRGRAAGQARYGSTGPWVIRYNPVLLRENGDSFLASTVPHEVAHLIAFLRYGPRIRPHGAEWRAIMEQFGATPERCHRYDLSRIPRRATRVFTYHCACSEHRLTGIRHRRVLAGQIYLCRRCAEALRPGRGTGVPSEELD